MTFTSYSPSNLTDKVGEARAATSAEIVEALRRAKRAQESWAKVPAPARGRVIANVGRLVEKNKETHLASD